MEFKKYNSVENSYNTKYIKRFLPLNIYDKKFVALEKLDGANFSIHISNDEIKFASRNKFLSMDEKFYDFQEAIGKINLQPLKDMAKDFEKVIFYGELFGDGIQKRVSYQKEKKIAFFDLNIDGKYQSFPFMEKVFNLLELEMVPIVKRNLTLEESLSIEVDNLVTLINPVEGNIMEGVVIRPMDNEIYQRFNRFILKQKGSKFKEKQHKVKVKIVDPVVEEWKNKILEYVTESRLCSLFSKEGVIENNKDIGKYIKLYIEDVKDDFLKDYPEFETIELEKNQIKEIMNISKPIVEMLQKELYK